jgi:hypothetical protein
MRDPFATADALPCDECPAALLDDYLAGPSGQLIAQVIDLDFALQAGVTVRLEDLSYPEFLLLRLVTEERNRYQDEQLRKASEHRHGR